MAVTGTLMKLVWGGRLFADETWACGLHVLGSSFNGTSALSFETPLRDWMTASMNYVSGGAKLDWIKFNAITPMTGKYASANTSDTFFLTSPVSGLGTPTPGQCALAVSLTTAAARGRGSKGRFFQPAGGQNLVVGDTGHINPGYTVGAANAAAALINSINAATVSRVVVFSKVGQLALPVTSVRCGDVLDTQRRRRSSLKELYSRATTVIT